VIFEMDVRPSDSPLVEQIWHARSVRSGVFQSTAKVTLMMVVTVRDGKASFTVRGPETMATPLHCDPDGEWIGIELRVGAYMPRLPGNSLVDRDVTLPGASTRSFWLDGSAWQFPDFENADTFVDRLVRQGLLVREPVVEAVLNGQMSDVSVRSVQRRFVHATGLSHRAIRQIERAQSAMALLQRGVSILDTVHEMGYSDQPHLTRALKRWLGQTPAEIAAIATFG
jgi:AraC-like DNA-binding protein